MNTMTCKGYAASIEYSDDDECFIGHIAGIKDRVGFHGESVIELKEAFHDAVEDYLETCTAVGKEPQKPYSGRRKIGHKIGHPSQNRTSISISRKTGHP